MDVYENETDATYCNEQGLDNPGFEFQENEQPRNSRGWRPDLTHLNKLSKSISKAENFLKSHTQTIKYVVLGLLACGYVAYFIAACVLDFNRATALVVLTCLGISLLIYNIVRTYMGQRIGKCFSPAMRLFNANLRWIKWVFIVVILVLLVTWLVLDMSNRAEQLISFAGVWVFVLLLFICSAHPRAVSWRAVFWGLGLQFAIGLFIIRTEPGLVASQWLGDQIRIFLDYTKAGSSFVFGENLINEAFAFQALPIVVFFSSVMSVLYYLGIMQWVIAKIAWIMQITMGTSAAETLSVAGNIFVGQTEAPLLIRPYLPLMTKSEIHAVMTGGFATIAGSVMGAYISFGIDASSLISASVMAAPCALALAKLSYPETQESSFKTMEKIKVDAGGEQNILEAASSGASASVVIVANIAVNLIAFIAILEFINATLRWLGSMVSYPEITFQMICSYVFMPVTFMMGIPYAEAFVAAELIGTKLFLNEFVAYKKLSELKNNRLNDTGSGGQLLSLRSETICTYALCGFANFSSLGIMIGGLSSICPSKRGDISQAVLRALLTGTCVSLVNACLAGMLYNSLDCIDVFRKVTFNSTSSDINQCCTDIFGSTLRNGTAMDFTGSWNGVKNATLYFTNCCNLYNNTKYC
ncbi:sodium/nucleoside cotransporter 1 isoform X1 [Paramormyrops kingsleyae]|uniref:sodium/nucleoside cotransporter 1 isoform X1 n=2 Tax=Paramormyrops kingsleyae TaxID=1676925 RepID=UPI003B976CA7